MIESHQIPEQMLKAVADYWTPERMKNAKPFPMETLKSDNRLNETPETGAPGLIPGKEPVDSEESEIENPTQDDITPMHDGYSYPPPCNSFYELVSLNTTYPWKTIGKVFFVLNGANYVASGASIGNNSVLTAGHCVVDPNTKKWATNWIFVPGYKNGTAPYGKWTAYRLSTSSEWYNNGYLTRDVGFVNVSPMSGVKLSQKVGYLGFAYNLERKQLWNEFGYSAAPPWNGQYLTKNEASYSRSDQPSLGPATNGTGSQLTPGCSGGPWIYLFIPGASGASNYANGVNSYCYNNYPYELFSPYFDSNTHNMYKDSLAY